MRQIAWYAYPIAGRAKGRAAAREKRDADGRSGPMRNGREVVDEEPARYALVSSANRTRKPDRFSEEEMALIRSVCEQEILGHPGVTVRSFDVTPTEIRLTCDTSPELPSEKVIREMWPEYYAGRRCRRNLDDPEVMLRVRRQARSIASLMGMMAQRITQALNRRDGSEGSVWSGRFRSILLASGPDLAVRQCALRAEPLFPAYRRRQEDWPEFALEFVTHVLNSFTRMLVRGHPFPA